MDFGTDILIVDSINLLFSFQGEFTPASIEDLLGEIEGRLCETVDDLKLRKRLYYISVECVQNLYHHAEVVPSRREDHDSMRWCSFEISENEGLYVIRTSNYVRTDKAFRIQEHLDHLNSFSSEELKHFYKEVLSNQTFSDKGGGGLGMIDIARKSNGKLEYAFSPSEYDGFLLYNLKVNIN